MSFQHTLRAVALLASGAILAACGAGSGTTPVAVSPMQAPMLAASAAGDPFALRENGVAIPHTHIMPSRSAASTFAPYLSPQVQGPLVYQGGAVQRTPSIYVVFWGFRTDPAGEAPRLTSFLKVVGASSWLGTVTQYYDSAGHITNPSGQLKGTWYDNASSVPLTPTDAQIKTEAVRLAEHFNVYNSNASYIVATPHGHNSSGFMNNYCAYHGQVSSHGSWIPYTNFPYMSDGGKSCGAYSVAGGSILDGVTIVGGHELAETQTDPTSGGWYDGRGNEIGDKCSWRGLRNTSFGTLTFPTQPLWSNARAGCVQ